MWSLVLLQYWSLLHWYNLRFRCGCVAVPVNWFFNIIYRVLRNLRTLYIVWSQVRGKQFNIIRCGCGAVAVIFSIYLNSVLYNLLYIFPVCFEAAFQYRFSLTGIFDCGLRMFDLASLSATLFTCIPLLGGGTYRSTILLVWTKMLIVSWRCFVWVSEGPDSVFGADRDSDRMAISNLKVFLSTLIRRREASVRVHTSAV